MFKKSPREDLHCCIKIMTSCCNHAYILWSISGWWGEASTRPHTTSCWLHWNNWCWFMWQTEGCWSRRILQPLSCTKEKAQRISGHQQYAYVKSSLWPPVAAYELMVGQGSWSPSIVGKPSIHNSQSRPTGRKPKEPSILNCIWYSARYIWVMAYWGYASVLVLWISISYFRFTCWWAYVTRQIPRISVKNWHHLQTE